MCWRRGPALDNTGERVVFVVCIAGSFIGCVDNVKSEQLTKGEKITQDGKSVRSLIR